MTHLPDHESLLSLCEDLMRMGEEAERRRALPEPPCQICAKGWVCLWHPKKPSFEERAHG